MNPYIVGNYKLTEKIGEGGMGAVFKGVDWMLEREVAVKVLRPELARQPHVLERFRAEAVTLAKLSHPNIATLYSFLRQGDDFFMVMEFVRGETLDSIIRRSGALPVDRAVALFCQALDGIAYAHKHGVVHRDIKPANIMLTGDGVVKVMDFGIARVLGSARMTKQGSIVGTVEYMSPEHVRGLETDARSDIYSLGILLYEMLTGRLPFSSSSEFDLMKAQIEDPPPPPRQFAPQIPEVMEQAILRSLAKAPDARFQTAGAFRDMLVGGMQPRTEPTSAAVIRETSGSTGPAPVRPAPTSTPTVHQVPFAKPGPPPPKKSKVWLWVLEGCGTFILLGVIVVVAGGLFRWGKAKEAGLDPELMEKNPALAVAKFAVAVNPDLEIVSTDNEKGLITFKDKKSGKTVTVNLEEAQSGKILFEEEGKEAVRIEAKGDEETGSLEIKTEEGSMKFGGGDVENLPDWLPSYPGAKPEGSYVAQSSESSTTTFHFTTSDSVESVISFYEKGLKESGLKVSTNLLRQDGKVTVGIASAEDADQKRTAYVNAQVSEGTTQVSVVVGAKK